MDFMCSSGFTPPSDLRIWICACAPLSKLEHNCSMPIADTSTACVQVKGHCNALDGSVQIGRHTFRGLKVMEEKEARLFSDPMPGIGPPPLTFSWLMKGLVKSADVPA